MSVAPPGAPPPPQARAPSDANAGRGDRFREMTRSRWFVFTIVILPLLAIAGGVAAGAPLFGLIGAVAVALIVLGVVFAIADNRAEDDFFTQYAAYRGMTQQPVTSVVPITPLLSRGDRNYYDHFMTGPVSKQASAPQCALAHYTYVEINHHTDSNGHTTTDEDKYPFTVCIVSIDQTARLYPAIDVTASVGGIFGSIAGKVGDVFDGKSMRKVELESAQFANDYHLSVSNQIDEVRIRELFSPQFIVWLTQNLGNAGFELRSGQLVVYVRKHVEESVGLDSLLDRSAAIAQRMLEEAAEEPAAT